MSKTKMQEARELIRAGRNNEARDILKTINHPLAKEWLQKLDKVAPDTRQKNVYASDYEDSHPYAIDDSPNTSGWARSTMEMQAKYDQEQERAKKRRKAENRSQWIKNLGRLPLEVLVVFISSIVAAVLYVPLQIIFSLVCCQLLGELAFGVIIAFPLKMIIRDKGQVYHVLIVFVATYFSVVFAKYLIFLVLSHVSLSLLPILPYWDSFTSNIFRYINVTDIFFATFGAFAATWIIVSDLREVK